jgi:SAM-dependent methyltransferase
MGNLDQKTVEGFGDEWSRFDQTGADEGVTADAFEAYFYLFPWAALPPGAVGFDLGCGSGRWAKLVAPRVGKLHCIDASEEALAVARRNLASVPNCEHHHASVDAIPLEDGSMDFGYSLGVLHHVPDTAAGIRACVAKLKPGAPFLVYLYYAFDNRPRWFRTLWRASDVVRRLVSRLPHGGRSVVSDALAAGVYFPMARTSALLERLGVPVDTVDRLPLSAYRHRNYYAMRTDSLDRFGTRLEQRFTADEVRSMMGAAGLDRVAVSGAPYWCSVGFKR